MHTWIKKQFSWGTSHNLKWKIKTYQQKLKRFIDRDEGNGQR